MDQALTAFTVRRHLHRAAERAENSLGEEKECFIEGCPREWAALPIPNGPITVGIDGGYVRETKKQGCFEVVAGKSVLAFRRNDEASGKTSRCFAFVQTYDDKPKRRLFDVLRSQGLQPNQRIIFLSDGGEDVRGVQQYLHP